MDAEDSCKKSVAKQLGKRFGKGSKETLERLLVGASNYSWD